FIIRSSWFFFSSRRRHTRFSRDWSSDVCSSDLPGTPVSWPVGWDDLPDVVPADFTVRSAPALLDGDPWATMLPAPQRVPDDVVAEGHEIPVARVAAMHEGKRRKRAAEQG